MQRIHFTVEDLSRLRLRATLGPVTEAVLALGLLGRPVTASYTRWRNQALRQLQRRPGLAELGRLTADDLLCLIDRSAAVDDSALRTLHRTPRQAASDVLEAWQVVVAPYWARVLGYLDAECDARGRIAMSSGVEQLLATLHPKIVWSPPVLEVPGLPPRDVHLDGRGLLLSPSMFLLDRPGLVIGAQRRTGQPALLFSVPPDPVQATALWDDPDNSVRALGALVGRTRAAALRALTATCTTSQLAERLGISSAGASQHATVLRETGLITTRRTRNTVLHTVTPLGMALLGGKIRER
ncbi:helix-turn-helix transcriptional regulator [Kutzneria buriramensis]|uniref:DNA-binding transcriptional ArsR family regulator n=1 Tax=Kutzneria buriramensis TaxID=1045776 RepID=A0A3E0HPM1_9PSEU|nr:winged helix-turn-helix domain-containing protein [Kutzneria buriramensis]REH48493.1 DNA-binding transcriptional ArsR family regulator [Kutzneria buriramensis]